MFQVMGYVNSQPLNVEATENRVSIYSLVTGSLAVQLNLFNGAFCQL